MLTSIALALTLTAAPMSFENGEFLGDRRLADLVVGSEVQPR